MGKKNQKELERLLSRPTDYTYKELSKLLTGLGYKESNQGKTSGSKVKFINPDTNHKIMIHKPHPSPVLKMYVIDLVIKQLKDIGEIKE